MRVALHKIQGHCLKFRSFMAIMEAGIIFWSIADNIIATLLLLLLLFIRFYYYYY